MLLSSLVLIFVSTVGRAEADVAFPPFEQIQQEINVAQRIVAMKPEDRINAYKRSCENTLGAKLPEMVCRGPQARKLSTGLSKHYPPYQCRTPSLASNGEDPCQEESYLTVLPLGTGHASLYGRRKVDEHGIDTLVAVVLATNNKGETCYMASAPRPYSDKLMNQPAITNLKSSSLAFQLESVLLDDCVACHSTHPWIRNAFATSGDSRLSAVPPNKRSDQYRPIMAEALRWIEPSSVTQKLSVNLDLKNLFGWRPRARFQKDNQCLGCHRVPFFQDLVKVAAPTISTDLSKYFLHPEAQSFQCASLHSKGKVAGFPVFADEKQWQTHPLHSDAEAIQKCDAKEGCHLLYGKAATGKDAGDTCESFQLQKVKIYSETGFGLFGANEPESGEFIGVLAMDPLKNKSCGLAIGDTQQILQRGFRVELDRESRGECRSGPPSYLRGPYREILSFTRQGRKFSYVKQFDDFDSCEKQKAGRSWLFVRRFDSVDGT